MSTPVTIAPLSQHQPLLPLVADWFVAEWPAWYGPGGRGDLWADLHAFAAADGALPVGVLAFRDGRAVGAAALKAESIASHRHLSPWAAAGYVLPELRGQGIGAALLVGLVATARAMGHATVYCGTRSARSLLLRSGWQAIDSTLMEGEPLTVFRSPA